MAHALLAFKLRSLGLEREVGVDSAGVAAFAGQPVDPRVKKALDAAGVPLRRKRARPLRPKDFWKQDYILAMDEALLEQIRRRRPETAEAEIDLLTAWMDQPGPREIPDPHFGNLAGFEKVRDLLDAALDAFIERSLRPRLRDG